MSIKKSIITDQISMDFEKAVEEITRYGFKYIEIHSLWNKTVEDLNFNEIEQIKNIIKKYNIKVSCLSTTLFLMCPLYTDVNNLEEFDSKFLVYVGNYDQHVNCLKKCIDFCHILDVEYIRIFPFRQEKNINKTYKEIINDISEKYEIPVRIAGNSKKKLIIENCPHTYLSRGLMTYEVVQKQRKNSLGLLWDVGNSFKALRLNLPSNYTCSILKEYEKIKEKIAYCHFKDYQKDKKNYSHCTYGEGSIEYLKLLDILNKNKYNSIISLEPEVSYNNTVNSIRNFNGHIQNIR